MSTYTVFHKDDRNNENRHSTIYAETPSKARYEQFLNYREVCQDVKFIDFRSQKIKDYKPPVRDLKNFKDGNQVVMFDCMEARHPNNYGKVWTCNGDSFCRSDTSPEVVFLKGFSGSFSCKFLQLVKV